MTGERPEDPTPRRSAGAAASRARRIGGRVRPAGAEPAAPAAGAEAPVQLHKPAADLPAPPPELSAPPSGASAPAVVVAVPGWLRWAPAAALSAGAVVMAVLLLVFSHGVWWAKPNGSEQRQQVLASAKTCVAASNDYKYTALDAYESKALACTTGQFRNQLKGIIERLVKVNAPRLKASQTAQISRGGVETITSDGRQWTVVLFGQLAVTNTNYPQGRTDPFAAQVRMQKDHGKWLMSDLKTISTPLS
jgi:hypothetical protein